MLVSILPTHDRSTYLVRCVARVGPGVDSTTSYDSKHEDGIVDAVKGMYQHSVALLNPSMLEPGNQPSNQNLGLYRRYPVRSIVGIDVHLSRSVRRTSREHHCVSYRKAMIELRLVVGPGENIFVRDWNMLLGEQRHYVMIAQISNVQLGLEVARRWFCR